MLQYEELRLRLENLGPDLEDLASAIGLPQMQREAAELEQKASADGFWNDMESAQKTTHRLSVLNGKIAAYQKLKENYHDVMTLIELADEEGDLSLLQECTDGVNDIAATIEKERLRTLLTGEYDANNAILTFHAGAGGTEAQDWAEMLYRMYTHWAETHGFEYRILDYLDGDEAGIKSASIMIEGENAYGYLRGESGVHRLVRVSPFDASGRRHTSFSAVEVMPEIDDSVEVDIRPSDLQIDTYRSSGAGGQHINKTESAIRITHRPTGLVVECQDERSQYKNKDKAMRVLRARLYERERERQQSAIAADRRQQVGSGDRSERIRTYNFPQNRVTDHRIGLTLYQLDDVMNGHLEPIIDALIAAEQAEKLKVSEETA